MTQKENIQAWVKKVQQCIDKEYAGTTAFAPVLEMMEGKRYYRIVRTVFKNRSAFAFIDKETGDIYKPASWESPAKHIRGNVVTAPDCYTAFGVKSLR